MTELRSIIEAAWENRELLKEEKTITTIRAVIELLDKGKLRVAEPVTDGWQVNEMGGINSSQKWYSKNLQKSVKSKKYLQL